MSFYTNPFFASVNFNNFAITMIDITSEMSEIFAERNLHFAGIYFCELRVIFLPELIWRFERKFAKMAKERLVNTFVAPSIQQVKLVEDS